MSLALGLRRRSFPIALAVLVAAALTLAAVAQAASGPSLLAPNKGKHFAVGAKITFKVRDRSANAHKYGVSLTVSAKRIVKHGELQMPGKNVSGDFAGMKRRKHGLWVYTPPRYTFPTWYMQRRGTYYWQASHIDCRVGGPKSCHIVSRIRKFHVG